MCVRVGCDVVCNGRGVGTLLFDVKAEPLAFLRISLLLAAVAVTAAYIPARRAARVDPMRTIRVDG